MGTESVWVPLALAAVSAAGTAYNQYDVAKKQNAASTDMMRTQQTRQREANAQTDQQIAAIKNSNADSARQQSLDGFLSTLRANAVNSRGTTPVLGGDRFQADANSTNAAIQNYGTNRADILSRILAPMEQRRNEVQGMARTNDELAGIARNAEADRFLSQLRMQNIHANPWISAGSQVAGAAAGAMAGSMPAGGVSGVNGGTVATSNGGMLNTTPGGRVFGGGGPLIPR
jgi:hypothetical protein